jgi:hypothetical protein
MFLKPNLITKLIVSDVSPNQSPSIESIRSILTTIKDIDLKQYKDVYAARKVVDKALVQQSSLKDVSLEV